MNKVAVVILNYNGIVLLRKFLPGVLEFSPGADIIVADNCSTDGSAEMLRQEFPAVRLIGLPENLGFCGGYNEALKQVAATSYVLLNSDVEVTKDWLTPQLQLLESNPDIAAVQPKILSWHQKSLFEYAGAGGGMIDALGYPFCRGRIFDTVEPDTGQYNDSRPVFWATGACLTIRSADFHSMGGFDTDFFAHMEEIDLCWKLNRSGRQVYYCGGSVVYHVGGGTLSRTDARKTYLNFRNALYLILKNMPASGLLWKLPLRVAMDWLAIASFLANGSTKNAMAVVKAHIHFIGGMGTMLQKRKGSSSLGFRIPDGLVYQKSLVIAYFLLRKRRNGDL